ncbi:MAG TPA: universal stress protein [Gaiellaceae bacterium]|jgi:nucleotide-binding universal stress UspA family protein|nr:universal stress protein [Gaiellaceae bacterium]
MNGIVVGVDGSPGSQAALAWAAREAKVHGKPLTLICTWQLPVGSYGWPTLLPELLDDFKAVAADQLAKACDAVGPALDGLEVTRTVREGSAANVLIEASEGADLLVVGTRGHGGFVGMLLGSVSAACAHHSRCPLVIVPPERT